jgi:hypothetical protein
MELTKDAFLTALNAIFHPIKINTFPGNLPISLHPDKLQLLLFGYIATLKADGYREFVLLISTYVFCINREFRIWQLTSQNKPIHCDWVLLDAECIMDKNDLHILAFDLLVWNGKNVTHLDILFRVELLRQFLSEHGQPDVKWDVPNAIPSNFVAHALHFTTSNMNVSIVPKPYFSVFEITSAYQNHDLPFAIDGIIFARRLATYMPFRSSPDNLIKWKQDHTIDFWIRCKDPIFELCLSQNDQLVSYTTSKEPNLPHNVVGEFLYQKDKKETWKFLKVRKDKTVPNTLETLEQTLPCVDVTFQDLCQQFEVH